MEIEFEATFADVDKDDIRARLKEVGAELVCSEKRMRRVNFDPVDTPRNSWVRVRDEGDRITMSYKVVDIGAIEGQKEVCIEIDDFDRGSALLEALGAKRKAYQETLREMWGLNGVEITIDTWPFLEPFVEIEGQSEQVVSDVAKKIGFDYSEALFCAVDELYHRKYGILHDQINNQSELTFDMENPFA